MSKDKQLDQLFRHNLKYHTLETPDHLWEQIDAKRDWKHKLINQIRLKRKPLGFFFLATTSLAFLFFLNYQSSKDTIGLASIPTESINAAQQSISSTTEKNTASTIDQNNLASINNSNEAAAENKIIATATTTNNPSNFSEQKNIVRTNLPTVITSENIKPQSAITDFNLSVPTITKDKVTAFTPNAITLTSDIDQSSILDEFVATPQTALDISPIVTVTNEQAENSVGVSLSTFLLSKKIALLETELNPLDDEKLKAGNCPSFKPKGVLHYYVDIFGSLDLAIRQITAKGPEYRDYATARTATESPNSSFSTGVRLSMVLGNGAAFRTGLIYSQINEVFKFSNEEDRVRVINVAIDTLINGPADTTFVWDTLSVYDSGTRYLTVYNKYRMVDIPLIVGFEVDLNDFIINANIGAYLNILFRQKGQFLSQNMQPAELNNAQDAAFKNRVGISYFASMGINYKITNKILLLFEPQIRYYPKSFTRGDYILNQNYTTVGILTGLRVRF